jgi:hypothetical protein
MNVYVIDPVADNPLYEGLALQDSSAMLNTWPPDWRANFRTWIPKSLKSSWNPPRAVGNVRKFNDYPCINLTMPAFSQRAVDLLHDILEPNGELLPVTHNIGTYYFYNCQCMTNCIDLDKSKTTILNDGLITSTERLVFIEECVQELTIFKVRTQLLEIFCTQTFVDRVNRANLQGFAFVPIWPLPPGTTYYDEMYRVGQETKKWKPKYGSEVDSISKSTSRSLAQLISKHLTCLDSESLILYLRSTYKISKCDGLSNDIIYLVEVFDGNFDQGTLSSVPVRWWRIEKGGCHQIDGLDMDSFNRAIDEGKLYPYPIIKYHARLPKVLFSERVGTLESSKGFERILTYYRLISVKEESDRSVALESIDKEWLLK